MYVDKNKIVYLKGYVSEEYSSKSILKIHSISDNIIKLKYCLNESIIRVEPYD